MLRIRSFVMGCVILAGTYNQAVAADAVDNAALTEKNRAIVLQFVDLFYTQRNVRLAFETFVAPDYVQHSPRVKDGRDAAISALTPLFSNPASRFDIKKVLVDGDLAAIHLRGLTPIDKNGAAVVDMYRLKDGKIVEHWDVLQAIPTKSENAHPMF